jgi:hypothetical protein
VKLRETIKDIKVKGGLLDVEGKMKRGGGKKQ